MYRWWQRVLSLLFLGVIVMLLINCSWFLKFFYPYPHQELVSKYCQEYEVDPYLVLAVIRTESRFYSKAESRVGARGLMQIMPETGQWIAKQMKISEYSEDKLYQPAYNIPMGIWYLAYLDRSFSGNLAQLLAAYNAGDSKVRKWLSEGTWTGRQQDLEQIPYQETRQYMERVLFDYQVYRRIYREK